MVRSKAMETKIRKTTRHKRKSLGKLRDAFDDLRAKIENGYDICDSPYFELTFFESMSPSAGTSAHTSNGEEYQVVPRLVRKRRKKNNNPTGALPVVQSNIPTGGAANASNEYNFTDSAIVASTPINKDIPNIRRNLRSSKLSALACNSNIKVSSLNIIAEESFSVQINEATVEREQTNNNPTGALPVVQSNIPTGGVTNASNEYNFSDSAIVASTPINKDIPNIRRNLHNSKSSALARNLNTKTSSLNIIAEEPFSVEINGAAVEREQSNQKSVRINAIKASLMITSYEVENPILMIGGKWRRALTNLRESRNDSGNLLQNRTFKQSALIQRRSIFVEDVQPSCSRSILRINASSRTASIDAHHSLNTTSIDSDQKALLLRKCGQTQPLLFEKVYSKKVLKRCRKIGEGVYGEVFSNDVGNASYVLKVVPIEGVRPINGSTQKRFGEILQEVIISLELSALRHNGDHQTAGFVEVLNVRVLKGRYPAHFLALWKAYEKRNGTENECPDCFDENQLYAVFELADSGENLEKYIFKNAGQPYSVFKQVALSLAVAESKFEFEHRDLHCGNILIEATNQENLHFSLNGRSVAIPSNGVKATIIDYTLSRIRYNDYILYQDLAADAELFEGHGDYQYDIYRAMRFHTEDRWERFEPFTNVLWMHYVIQKILDAGVRDSTKKTDRAGRIAIGGMKQVKEELFDYESVVDFVEQNLMN